MLQVEVYSKGYCPFCHMAKSTLRGLGVEFKEIDIMLQPQKAKEMRHRSKRKTVPQIFVNNHHVGGNDDLQQALLDGTWLALTQT